MDSYITFSYGRLLDVLDKRLQNRSLRPFSVGHTTSICNVQRTFNIWPPKKVLDGCPYNVYLWTLLDGLDRRHKNFHFQTILSWSHDVYDRPPTDVTWRFCAHWAPCGLLHKWILQSGPFYLCVVLTTLVCFTWYKSKTCTFNMWTWTKWQRKISIIGHSSLQLMWTTAILLWTHFPSVKSAGIMSFKKFTLVPFFTHTQI